MPDAESPFLHPAADPARPAPRCRRGGQWAFCGLMLLSLAACGPAAGAPAAKTGADGAVKPIAPGSSDAQQPLASPVTPARELAAADAAGKDERAAVEDNPFPGRVPVGSLDTGADADWLNTSGPITLKDLRGKLVLLDFWTYCCINCMHILPDLKYLEHKYPRQLVVIGVHSAKFDNERDTSNIRGAIMRYEIEHPVLNDADMVLWRKLGVRSWPTVVLIDPEGQAIFAASGEGNRDKLDAVIGRAVSWYRAKGTLDETPVRFDLERERSQPTPLRFPGKVLADPAGDRLFISDSNHHRIVVASLAGKLREIIGSGALGRVDGSFDKARFDRPQGMALVGETLYIADTENHCIREIDLLAKTVKTLAGTGKQAKFRAAGGPLSSPLNSPWDLVHLGGKLYVAMAGPHQIWVIDLKAGKVSVYAGSGREDIVNGPLATAALAQPSGITTDGKELFVVDSEGSAVRRIGLGPDAAVSTIVGTSDQPNGRCLFNFGDRDGAGDAARLQHPLGVLFHDGGLFVADSYNHKIKRVDLERGEITTFLGDGKPGDQNDPPRFSEPAGLAIAGDTLYIADANNHQIRTVDLTTKRVATLAIEGLAPPHRATPSTGPAAPVAMRVRPQSIAAGPTLAFEVALPLPDGFKLNKLAPIGYRISAPGEQTLIDAKLLGERREAPQPAPGEPVQIELPLAAKSGRGELQLTLTYSYCRDGVGGLCKMSTLSWIVPIELAAQGGDKSVQLSGETDSLRKDPREE